LTQALDWAWETLILNRYSSEIVLITEQDVFLTAPFSLTSSLRPKSTADSGGRGVGKGGGGGQVGLGKGGGIGGESTGGCFISGVLQERENMDGFKVRYLHPSAIIIDLEAAPFREMMRFSPTVYNGSDLDTGQRFQASAMKLALLHIFILELNQFNIAVFSCDFDSSARTHDCGRGVSCSIFPDCTTDETR